MSNYLIWTNSVTQSASGEMIAVVELKPTNISQVSSGSMDFIQEISDALHLPLQVKDWSITPFRSAYYSDYPESDDWEDQFPLCWRITLTGQRKYTQHSDPDILPTFLPLTFDGYDSTWHPLQEPPVSPECVYVAMGVSFGMRVTGELASQWAESAWPRASVETISSTFSRSSGTLIRLDLGPVNLERQYYEIASIDERLRGFGLLTRWNQVKLRMARLTHGES
ncbi:hypothetical protein ACFU6I_06540 [Streptomyces sp. NPDC057486]|uniref:hypothetical protein n=1 Tax=Streptomyces sp. NPDC057486 TaxID=3346145 RepID=UPI0036BAFE23